MAQQPGLRRELVEILTPLGWLSGTLHVPAHLPLREHLLLSSPDLKITGVRVPGEPELLRFLAYRRDAVMIIAPTVELEESAASAYASDRDVACLLPGSLLRGTLQVHTNLRLSDHVSLEGPWLTLRHCLLTPYGGTADSRQARSLHTAIVNLSQTLGIADVR